MAEKDYYEILEVHRNASREMIKTAYRFLALRYHPDRHDLARKEWAHGKFVELSQAYQVISDPAARREYDRGSYDVETEKPAEARIDEEAYFYYRIGLEHYKDAEKTGTLRILFGRRKRYLKLAMDDFATVLDDYPASKYGEDAHYYYIRILAGEYRYTVDHIKELKEEFDEFFNEYPRSKWKEELKLQFAKFYYFKEKNPEKAKALLEDVRVFCSQGVLAEEAKILSGFMDRKMRQKEK